MSRRYVAALLTVLLLLTSCDRPLRADTDISGCYFAAGQQPVIRIVGKEIRNRRGQNVSSIESISNVGDYSSVEVRPSVMFTEDAHKSLSIDKGNERYLMAFLRRGTVHIVVAGTTVLDLVKRPCAK
jgi:hypothetical protein